MTWNPSREVAVARDAAKALLSPMCVIIWLASDGSTVNMASYGMNSQLCKEAGKLGNHILDAALLGVRKKQREKSNDKNTIVIRGSRRAYYRSSRCEGDQARKWFQS